MTKAIQIVATYSTTAEAAQALDFQSIQVGFLGGHTYLMADGRTTKMQAFHECPEDATLTEGWNLDDTRVTLVPDNMAKRLRFDENRRRSQ